MEKTIIIAYNFVGFPKILQSDNGLEYKNLKIFVNLMILNKYLVRLGTHIQMALSK